MFVRAINFEWVGFSYIQVPNLVQSENSLKFQEVIFFFSIPANISAQSMHSNMVLIRHFMCHC